MTYAIFDVLAGVSIRMDRLVAMKNIVSKTGKSVVTVYAPLIYLDDEFKLYFLFR